MATGLAAYAQEGTPRMFTAEPTSAQRGDVVTIAGDYLDTACVAKVFLTDGKTDTPVDVTEQSKTTVKLKIPDKIGAGRWAVMVLTVGPNAKYIEEPVKVLIPE
ncbi:MAG TPA: hypothetical protein VG096_03450 [Bryobacteraceae bacterium]|jgi:nitrous oxidase accessory protein NosD|nr:hypothetical protein [Bryobacteraceae bacterium]